MCLKTQYRYLLILTFDFKYYITYVIHKTVVGNHTYNGYTYSQYRDKSEVYLNLYKKDQEGGGV